MLVWATASAFLFFIPLALALAWQFGRRKKSRPSVQFGSIAFAADLRSSLRARLRWLPQALLLAALVCAIIALARPQRSDTKVKKNVEGIDIILTLDISDSMVIEDMEPYANRIDAAKKTLMEFVKGRPNDRIGFVVFMGEAYTKVPLTLDHDLLLKSISETMPSRNIKMGTAIGSALATAVGRIKDSEAKSRVIVLATDGENNTGTISPETAIEIAKGYGLRVYAIGMGKDGESKMPIEETDIFGRKVKRYQMIHSDINNELLQSMADQTGGKYYRATDGNALLKVFRDIDKLERSKIEMNQFTKYAELFPSWLTAAVWLSVLSLVFGQTLFRRLP